MNELDARTIDTSAGKYTVAFYQDDMARQPEDAGFVLAVEGCPRYIDIDYGDVPAEALVTIRDHGGNRDYTWDRELRSGAALVRYLALKGYKGVTLVDDHYRPVEPSRNRRERVYGVAIAPDDATSPDEYVRNALRQWQAWGEGDTFGYAITAPDGSTVESVWGYYGYWMDDTERDYVLSEASATVREDAQERVDAANLVGSGLIGIV